MPFNATEINENLSSSDRATATLASSCQGIISTYIAPSNSAWYSTLYFELEQAQTLAQQWRSQYSTKLKEDILTHVVLCGQAFAVKQPKINQLFEQASDDLINTKFELERELTTLKSSIQMIYTAVATYEQNLRNWSQKLEQIHRQMADTISRIQEEEAPLKSQIDSVNDSIIYLQTQIIADREAIAKVRIEESNATVENVFGILFASFTGGLSLILAGIGVSSIVEAEGKVSAIERTINDYQSRISSAQERLTQDEAQLVALNGLTFSAGIALNDIDVAQQMLDIFRISWESFDQELDGAITKIINAQTSDVFILEKAWFHAACNEWNLIVMGTHRLIRAST